MDKLLRGYDETKHESEYQYLLEEYGVHKANGAGYIAYRDGKEYITEEYYGQGYIYKDYDAWIYEGIVYVPEYGFPKGGSEWVTLEGLPGTWTLVEEVNFYTKEDFINLIKEYPEIREVYPKHLTDEQIAYDIFDIVDWQFPESYIDIDLPSLKEARETKTSELDKLLSWDKGSIVGIPACVGTNCDRTIDLEDYIKKEGFSYIGPKNSFWYDGHEDFIYNEEGFLVNVIAEDKVEELGNLGIVGFNQNEVYVWEAPLTKEDLSTGTVKELVYGTELDGTNYRIDKKQSKIFKKETEAEPEQSLEEGKKQKMKEEKTFRAAGTKVRDWYMKEYPEDEVGKTLDPQTTFEDLDEWFMSPGHFGGKDIYDILGGDADSVIRERVFNELLVIYNQNGWEIDYQYLYNLWLDRERLNESMGTHTNKKTLKEATGNFTLSDYGFPTFAYMAWEWALDYIYYDLSQFGYDANAEYETIDADDEARYAAEEKGIEYMHDRWKALPEEFEVNEAIEEANGDIYDLFNNTPLNKDAELELGNNWEDRFGEWSVYDEYSYELPKIKIEAGYYEGASIVIEIPYIEVINAYDLNDKIADIMYKHFGKDGLGLASIGVAYRFSSGETGYNLKVENRQEYDLQARYDARASFYGKARVIEEGNKQILVSYNTIVAEIEDGVAKVFNTYSQTTLRHIKEFLLQNGFKADNKAQIMVDYGADRW